MTSINEAILAVGKDFWTRVGSRVPAKGGRFPFHQKLKYDKVYFVGDGRVRVGPSENAHTTYLEFSDITVDGPVTLLSSSFRNQIVNESYAREFSNTQPIEQSFDIEYTWKKVERKITNHQTIFDTGVVKSITGSASVAGLIDVKSTATYSVNWNELNSEQNTSETTEIENLGAVVKVPANSTVEFVQLEKEGTLLQRSRRRGKLNAKVYFYSKNNFDTIRWSSIDEMYSWAKGESSRHEHYIDKWAADQMTVLDSSLRNCEQIVEISIPHSKLGTTSVREVR